MSEEQGTSSCTMESGPHEQLPESSEIRRLDADTVRRITAEQAISDLSSIVKELMDNALDAESTTIKSKFDFIVLFNCRKNKNNWTILNLILKTALFAFHFLDYCSPIVWARASYYRGFRRWQRSSHRISALFSNSTRDLKERAPGGYLRGNGSNHGVSWGGPICHGLCE